MLLSLAAPGTIVAVFLTVAGLAPTLLLCAILIAVSSIAAIVVNIWCIKKLPKQQKGSVGFFHPAANGGGGGERVLWCAVSAIQAASPHTQIILYSGDGLSIQQLLANAASNFNIKVTDKFQVVPLHKGYLVQPEQYPQFTLIGQFVGAVGLGHEALSHMVPEIFVDTTGWASVYPLARLAGCKVVAYTHYPTVSTDMLQRVKMRQSSFNNQLAVANSWTRSALKMVYYYCFAAFYGLCGGFANVSIVNSTWTANHIRQLWWKWSPPICVFPPCNADAFQQLPLDRKLKRLYLVSVAQFRPEKNHELQLQAFALARKWASEADSQGHSADSAVLAAQLKIVGGCQRPAEQSRLAGLKQLAQDLGLQDCVDFLPNASYEDISSLLGGAVGGLHTMQDEHFGISIVEYMAAGVVPIVHDSGGPQADIVRPEVTQKGSQNTGFRCTSVEEYAEAITLVLCMDQKDRLDIGAAARRRASRFSDQLFKEGFLTAIQPLIETTLVGA